MIVDSRGGDAWRAVAAAAVVVKVTNRVMVMPALYRCIKQLWVRDFFLLVGVSVVLPRASGAEKFHKSRNMWEYGLTAYCPVGAAALVRPIT